MKTRLLTGFLISFLFALPLSGQNHSDNKPIRDFQMSIIPFIGTDGAETLHNRYEASLNIFAGITGGVEKFEAGGFLNITIGHVNGMQLSGFGNLATGHVNAFQAAGFFNVNSGNFNGFMGSGFINVAAGQTQGFSGAGFANVVGGGYHGFSGAGFANVVGGGYHGFSGAGFGNVAGGDIQGFQGAGFGNVAGGNLQGFQGAGFGNVAGGDIQGFQGAGFGNVAGGNVKGAQLSGFINISKNIQGIQGSGFFNMAREVRGVQIGVINLADTIAEGLPIGVLSIVKKGGLRQFEIGVSDVSHLSGAFRIGTPHFYNIFSINLRPFAKDHYRAFGYGIGSNIPINDQISMQPELHSTQLHGFRKWDKDKLDLLNEFRLNLGLKSSGPVALFAGVVLYNQLYTDDPESGFSATDIAPDRLIYEGEWRDFASKWWLGARAGLRFNISAGRSY